MSIDDRISRLEQRLGLVEEDDLIICLLYEEPDGTIAPDGEPALTVRVTPQGTITTYGRDWRGLGPHTKVLEGIDPRRI